MRILAVDDDPTSRTILAAALTKLGHSVEVAADAEEALRIAAAEDFSLLVTDWMMPDVDGLELAERLRALRPASYVYVLMLTGVEGRANWLKAMDAGVDDLLPKPVDQAVLGARIRVAERMLGLVARNRTLARLIPICMYCKKARTDSDYWLDLDRYLAESGDTKVSHGVCPTCNEKHVAPMLRKFLEDRAKRKG